MRPPADRGDDEERRAALADHEEVDDDGNRHERQDGISAEPGNVARRLLEPRRPDRVREIVRIAQAEEKRPVEGRGVALQHFAGDLDEGEGEEAQGGERHEGPDLVEPQAGPQAMMGEMTVSWARQDKRPWPLRRAEAQKPRGFLQRAGVDDVVRLEPFREQRAVPPRAARRSSPGATPASG